MRPKKIEANLMTIIKNKIKNHKTTRVISETCKIHLALLILIIFQKIDGVIQFTTLELKVKQILMLNQKMLLNTNKQRL